MARIAVILDLHSLLFCILNGFDFCCTLNQSGAQGALAPERLCAKLLSKARVEEVNIQSY